MNAASILPEIILGLGAIVLMMVAAFVRRAGSVTHWRRISRLHVMTHPPRPQSSDA